MLIKKEKILSIGLSLALVASLAVNIKLSVGETNLKVDRSQYDEMIADIKENFKVEGYEEVAKDSIIFMALPEEANFSDFSDRVKLFVYKGTKKDSVIMLEISYAEQTFLSEEWYASFDYNPEYFNRKNSVFGSETANPNIPEIQLCTNSFRLNGFHYTITCFAPNSEKLMAPNEITSFTNQLLKFLRD